MAKFITIDVDGFPSAFYDSDVGVVPDGAIEISEAEYQEFRGFKNERKWDVSTGTVVQEIRLFGVDAEREDKIAELKEYAVFLIQTVIPGVKDVDTVDMIAELWMSIATVAKQPTSKFQYAIDVRQAAKAAITVLNGMTDELAIRNYDVVSTPGWPV